MVENKALLIAVASYNYTMKYMGDGTTAAVAINFIMIWDNGMDSNVGRD